MSASKGKRGKGKGFQRKTAGEAPQVDVAKQVQALTQFINQIAQNYGSHLQNLQREVTELCMLTRYLPATEGAKLGDRAIIDCLGKEYLEDGSLKDEFIAETTFFGFSMVLETENNFFPELVEKLKGAKSGDTLNVDAVVPENYPTEAMRGKKVNLDVSVLAVYTPAAVDQRLTEARNDIAKRQMEKRKKELEAQKAKTEASAAKAEDVSKSNEAK